MSRPALSSSSFALRWLARWRVPLGFVFAAIVFWLARPTRASLLLGIPVALSGEAIRVWAAGHVEKSREVTVSGPYRWTRHPLYVGSTVIGLGLAIAAAHPGVALLIAAYLAATITGAVRTEEAYLSERFGAAYSRYVEGSRVGSAQRFSVARAVKNREYRAVSGVLAGIGVLVLKAWAG